MRYRLSCLRVRGEGHSTCRRREARSTGRRFPTTLPGPGPAAPFGPPRSHLLHRGVLPVLAQKDRLSLYHVKQESSHKRQVKPQSRPTPRFSLSTGRRHLGLYTPAADSSRGGKQEVHCIMSQTITERSSLRTKSEIRTTTKGGDVNYKSCYFLQ